MSATQNETAARFRALHDGPGAFVIPNPWDVGSARILAGWLQGIGHIECSLRLCLGRRDHGLNRDEALAHAHLISVLTKKNRSAATQLTTVPGVSLRSVNRQA